MLMTTMRTVLLLLVLAAAGASAAPFAVIIERPDRTLDTSAFTTFDADRERRGGGARGGEHQQQHNGSHRDHEHAGSIHR